MKKYIKSTIAPVRTLNDWIEENKDKGPKYKYIWILDYDEPTEFVFFDGRYDELPSGAGLTKIVEDRYKNTNLSIHDIYDQYEILEELPYEDGGIAVCVGKLY